MSDQLNSDARSKLMARVRGKNTNPELVVRRLAHALGYRFRLHRRELPGRPDITFPSKRKVVFVHGCFWHRHPRCSRASLPKTRQAFWLEKFNRNVARDRRNIDALRAAGWGILVIWECETKDPTFIRERLTRFLE